MSRKGVALMKKQYIGDGVYVEFDGWAIVLTTENGVETTNRVVLETEVYSSLVAYVDALKSAAEKARESDDAGESHDTVLS
jgi:hypothetical protein